MSEISLSLLFPKAQIGELTHSFNSDKEASSILDFVTNTYPDQILPSSQIMIQTEYQRYSIVQQDTLISSLDFQKNQVIIMPDRYQVQITDPNGNEIPMEIRNGYVVSQIMQVICVRSHLLDPKFYKFVSAQGLALSHDDTLSSQAPFDSSFEIRMNDPDEVLELIKTDFINGEFSCSDREASLLIAILMQISLNQYSKTMAFSMLEKECQKYIPKRMDKNQSKSTIKSACDIYKKMKLSENATQEFIETAMKLPYFESMIINGEFTIGPKGKRASKDRVTFALGYSYLSVFKQNSTNVLYKFFISDFRNLKIVPSTGVCFEITNEKGEQSASCKVEDYQGLYDIIHNRLKEPSASRRNRSSEGAADSEIGFEIPRFVQQFNLYSDLPRQELLIATAYASIVLIAYLNNATNKLRQTFQKINEAKSQSVLNSAINSCVNLSTGLSGLIVVINEANANLIYTSGQLIKSTSMSIMTTRGSLEIALANIQAAGTNKKKAQEAQDQMKGYSNQISKDLKILTEAIDNIDSATKELQKELQAKVKQPAPYHIQKHWVETVRSMTLSLLAASWLNEISDCRGTIAAIKQAIADGLQKFGDISTYTDKFAESKAPLEENINLIRSIQPVANSIIASNVQREPILNLINETVKLLDARLKAFDDFFVKKQKPIELVPYLGEIQDSEKIEPRPLVSRSHELLTELSENVDNLPASIKKMTELRTIFTTLLGNGQKGNRGPLIIAFNDFKADVERNYATAGFVSALATANRCKRALDALFDTLNPAKELRQMLSKFPSEDPRAKAIFPIIDYLDEHGPLYYQSAKHVLIEKFIVQMGLQNTNELIDLAYKIEDGLPSELKKVADTCDPIRFLYKELEGELEVSDLMKAAAKASEEAAKKSAEARKSLKEKERECASKYRNLNQRLWRIMIIFGQFAQNETQGTVGYNAFTKCRAAFKTLIEEAAFDMKRERLFMEFIDEFIQKCDDLIQNPHRVQSISSLSNFLLAHQIRSGFYEAAKALSEFNHYLLCVDSNKAADELEFQSAQERQFRQFSLMVAQLRSRLNTVNMKIETTLRAKIMRDSKRSDIDLRGDFKLFMKKFTDNLFIIFSQLIVARCQNQAAIQALSTGVDAIEKLVPSIANIEIPAPYFARSVCGIVFASIEPLIAECKIVGGKAAQSSDLAFLAVREFLFNIRRKIADSDREKMSQKTGIGIADMLAVIEREQKAAGEVQEFQRQIRKRKWT